VGIWPACAGRKREIVKRFFVTPVGFYAGAAAPLRAEEPLRSVPSRGALSSAKRALLKGLRARNAPSISPAPQRFDQTLPRCGDVSPRRQGVQGVPIIQPQVAGQIQCASAAPTIGQLKGAEVFRRSVLPASLPTTTDVQTLQLADTVFLAWLSRDGPANAHPHLGSLGRSERTVLQARSGESVKPSVMRDLQDSLSLRSKAPARILIRPPMGVRRIGGPRLFRESAQSAVASPPKVKRVGDLRI